MSTGTDGHVIVYDYGRLELEREMAASEAGVAIPSDLLLMENENTLIISDSRGLHSFDI